MQTVSEAKYTYWHSIIDIAASSGLSKEEWCRKYKIALKTFNHYEGIFKRQEARGYVYGGTDQSSGSDVDAEPVLAENVAERDRDKEATAAGKSMKQEEPKRVKGREESIYVEIPMPEEAVESWAVGDGAEDRNNTADQGQLVIQVGSCRLSIGEGVKEETLRMVLKAVGGNA